MKTEQRKTVRTVKRVFWISDNTLPMIVTEKPVEVECETVKLGEKLQPGETPEENTCIVMDKDGIGNAQRIEKSLWKISPWDPNKPPYAINVKDLEKYSIYTGVKKSEIEKELPFN